MRIGYSILDDPASLARRPDEPVLEISADSALDNDPAYVAQLKARLAAGDESARAELNAMELDRGTFARVRDEE